MLDATNTIKLLLRSVFAWATVATLVVIGTTAISCGPAEPARSTKKKLVVLGFDGMDPRLCERLMDAGELPHLAAMRAKGGYRPLGTSIPPQSPVAWSNFITGANPGVHGIFDFIHRDPRQQNLPYYSAADTVGGKEGWEVGQHKLPLTFWPFNHAPAKTILKRQGVPFWHYLDEAGISVAKYDIPANYPPTKSAFGHVCCLSGMGVPDLLGGYGTYQYFSEDTVGRRSEGGGVRKSMVFYGDTAACKLTGPENTYLQKSMASEIPFQVHRHPTENTARIDLPGQTIPLRAGEWSEWIKLEFALDMPSFLPDETVPGICRFFLKEVRPTFKLYASPINIDPSDPKGQLISEPPDFVEEISDDLGLFHTTGFQEDHKALSNGVFSDEDFARQADFVLEERINLLDYALGRYEDGLLFFYFSSTDLQAHMFWWDSDDPHPMRSAAEAEKYHRLIVDLYRRMDSIIGDTADRLGEDTPMLVMSDHGFCNFRREFNINTWLRSEGYLQPADCKQTLNPAGAHYADWTQTKAYGLGLNGLYLNLNGRERDGIVAMGDREALLREMTDKLLKVRDPKNGKLVFGKIYRSEDIYSGPHAGNAPDLILGYNRGYRASWATTLGDVRDEMISDNRSAWSADHCVAADQVPGVLFSNRRIESATPSLIDLAPTILREFGVTPPETMRGSNVFEPAATAAAGN